MAVVEFLMTPADTRAFVGFLIDRFSARFALEKTPTPEPLVYDSLDAVMSVIVAAEYSERFLVQSPLWDRFPICTTEIHANDGQHFFVHEGQYGGPTCGFIWPSTHSENDAKYMLPGQFHHFPYYFADDLWLDDHSKYQTFRRPDEIAMAYREVQKYVRRNGCQSEHQGKKMPGPWILRGALEEYQAGVWLGYYKYPGWVPRRSR